MKNLIEKLRVFKRINHLEEQLTLAYKVAGQQGSRLNKLEDFIESREPCKICGKHRYNSSELLNRPPQ